MQLMEHAKDATMTLADHASSGAAVLAELADDARESAADLVEEVREARRWMRALLIVLATTGLVVLVMAVVRARRENADIESSSEERPPGVAAGARVAS